MDLREVDAEARGDARELERERLGGEAIEVAFDLEGLAIDVGPRPPSPAPAAGDGPRGGHRAYFRFLRCTLPPCSRTTCSIARTSLSIVLGLLVRLLETGSTTS